MHTVRAVSLRCLFDIIQIQSRKKMKQSWLVLFSHCNCVYMRIIGNLLISKYCAHKFELILDLLTVAILELNKVIKTLLETKAQTKENGTSLSFKQAEYLYRLRVTNISTDERLIPSTFLLCSFSFPQLVFCHFSFHFSLTVYSK